MAKLTVTVMIDDAQTFKSFLLYTVYVPGQQNILLTQDTESMASNKNGNQAFAVTGRTYRKMFHISLPPYAII